MIWTSLNLRWTDRLTLWIEKISHLNQTMLFNSSNVPFYCNQLFTFTKKKKSTHLQIWKATKTKVTIISDSFWDNNSISWLKISLEQGKKLVFFSEKSQQRCLRKANAHYKWSIVRFFRLISNIISFIVGEIEKKKNHQHNQHQIAEQAIQLVAWLWPTSFLIFYRTRIVTPKNVICWLKQ